MGIKRQLSWVFWILAFWGPVLGFAWFAKGDHPIVTPQLSGTEITELIAQSVAEGRQKCFDAIDKDWPFAEQDKGPAKLRCLSEPFRLEHPVLTSSYQPLRQLSRSKY